MMAIFVNGSGRNEKSQQRTFHRCFLPSFGSFGQTVSEKNLIFSRFQFFSDFLRTGNGHVWWQSGSSFMVWKSIIYALFLYNLVATLLFTIFKELKKKKIYIFFVTIAAIFHKRTRVSNHKSESGSYMHHFHKVWWQLAFYRILKYVFWQ